MPTLPILPEQPGVDPTGDYARVQAWAILQVRYMEVSNQIESLRRLSQAAMQMIASAMSAGMVCKSLLTTVDLSSYF
jgi:hypothetical protein